MVSVEELVVDSGLIAWAFHSDCQEALVGSFLPNEPSWPEMRTLGVGFWFTNAIQLRSRVIFGIFAILLECASIINCILWVFIVSVVNAYIGVSFLDSLPNPSLLFC